MSAFTCTECGATFDGDLHQVTDAAFPYATEHRKPGAEGKAPAKTLTTQNSGEIRFFAPRTGFLGPATGVLKSPAPNGRQVFDFSRHDSAAFTVTEVTDSRTAIGAAVS